jgi:NAD dependent epimerase/dehydratase family enzyme
LLKRLLLPFKLGIGGRLGSGDQYMSWIALGDELRAILHAVDNGSIAGALNLTAPNPVTNRVFTESLGRAVHRPTVLPTPLFALKTVYGGELVATLLGSQRVSSGKLQSSGFEFAHPGLDAALDDILHS